MDYIVRVDKYSFDPVAGVFRGGSAKTPRELIDEAMRDALDKPRREAEEASQATEVKRRMKILKQIGMEDAHEPGTVLRWTRRYGWEEGERLYSYVAIKIDNVSWYVTGKNMAKVDGWTWRKLIEWMVTGESVVEGVEIAASWRSVS